MSFNSNVPLHSAALKDKIDALDREKRFGINWGHECDCEFCDSDGDDADPDAEIKADKIDAEIKAAALTLKRLKRYALDHNIKLTEEKI